MNNSNKFSKKIIDKWGKYTLYLVNDEKIRNSAEYAEEFSDYGMNIGKKGLATLNFKFIPENEIWIAKSIKPSERHYVISNALAYIRGIERGLDPGDSYDKAIDKEKSVRTKDALNKLHIKNYKPADNLHHKDIPKKVYIKKYGVINDEKETVNIFLINGEVVRDLYKTDYVEGGHAYVYDWIPLDEIWIEKTVKQDEIPVIILHEFLERTLMKYKKFPYVRAHVAASKVEFEHRGLFNKKDALSLTRSIVMNKLLRNINY
ncbi:MAG TPA: hypothetical protein VIL99_04555 [Ignavibacteria bacterium]